jgi:NADH:ubiquinone oxidoreductase subunit 2 (subunit N)
MFIRDAVESAPALAGSFGLRFALGLSVIATLGIGLYPEPFLQFAQRSLFR